MGRIVVPCWRPIVYSEALKYNNCPITKRFRFCYGSGILLKMGVLPTIQFALLASFLSPF